MLDKVADTIGKYCTTAVLLAILIVLCVGSFPILLLQWLLKTDPDVFVEPT